jgi:hypothetical protein
VVIHQTNKLVLVCKMINWFILHKIFFMVTKIKHNYFSKLLLCLMVLLTIGICSCNDTASKDEKKDTAAGMAKDTSMKMSTDTTKVDSTKTDTTGRGTQPPPPPKH